MTRELVFDVTCSAVLLGSGRSQGIFSGIIDHRVCLLGALVVLWDFEEVHLQTIAEIGDVALIPLYSELSRCIVAASYIVSGR